MSRIEVRPVSPDMIPAWNELSREVEELFQGVMADTPGFRDFMEASVSRCEAFAAIEIPSRTVLGIIAISREKNEILWLAVSVTARGKGAGSKLLETAIRELDAAREISVITFVESDPEGLLARKLYLKYGFINVDDECIYDGHPRCLMKRPANNPLI